MPFSDSVKTEALVRSRRHCCICHVFAGRSINVHHIAQEADGGANDLDNAIALCLRCHGEAGHYNPRHPIGNKYSPTELRRHRDEWWQWCADNPYCPLPEQPIDVSPWRIGLGTSGWQTRAVVKVYNRSESVLYQIYLRVLADSTDVDLLRIRLAPINPRESSQIDEVVPGIGINTTVIRFDGIDPFGRQKAYILIDSLDPKEILQLVLQDSATRYSGANVFVTVCNYEREPGAVRVTADGKIAVAFSPPETIRITKTSFLMQRIERGR